MVRDVLDYGLRPECGKRREAHKGSRAMVAQPHRRWAVLVRGEKIGEVYGVTARAACVRAALRFKISREDQEALEVRRLRERSKATAL
jgi:hypothetical protein